VAAVCAALDRDEPGKGAGGDPAAALRALAYAQRQACAAARNMAARCEAARPALLTAGVEPLLRAARARFPGECGDVGGAALRDLGFEDYSL
jgi:hypothetical protein